MSHAKNVRRPEASQSRPRRRLVRKILLAWPAMSETMANPDAFQPATAADAAAPPPAASQFGHRLMPPGDPLSGAAFDTIYEKTVEPELAALESGRRNGVMFFFLALIGGAVLIYVEYLLLPVLTHAPAGRFAVDVFGITGIVAAVLGYLPLRKVARTAKLDVISALCQPIGVAYQMKVGMAPAFDRFLDLHLLPRPSDKSFEDLFTGRRGGTDFALCEAHLSQGSGKSRHTVFQGQLFQLDAKRQRLGTTVVLRNTGWLNRFECPAGLRRVGLEDPHFDQVFAVFASDQVEAREILTPAFMQQLVDLETAYAGKHLRCAFCGGELLLALEGGNRFEIGNMFATLVNRARVEGIARDVEQMFKLIDEFAGA